MTAAARPPHPRPGLSRFAGGALPLAALTTAIALTVYAPTVARDLTWAGDGGELITASMTLGVPHPPGYPTYVLLGRLFALLPAGAVAWRFNLFSAVCAAAAAGLLAVATRQAWGGRARPVAAVAAALAFAFLPLVWSQAVVAEVYSLNLLLVAAFLAVWAARGPGLASGLCLGLALTTHLTSLLLLPAALLAAGPGRARLLAGCALGLLPLLALPWLARGDSPVVWGQPDTLRGWWWLVSGRLYAANLRVPPAAAWPDAARLAGLLRALAIGATALLAGRADIGRRVAAPTRPAGDRWPLLLGATAGLYALFALVYATPDAAVLLLPALLLLAFLLAPRLDVLGGWAVVLPLALAVAGLLARADSPPSPRVAAEAALTAAPPRALLLTPGDRSLFALWYVHHVEGQRPDVVIADANLFAFDWYRLRLAQQRPDLFVPATDDLLAFRRSNAATRPVCAVSLTADPAAGPLLYCNEVTP